MGTPLGNPSFGPLFTGDSPVRSTPQTGIPGQGALFAGVCALLVFSGKVRAGGAGARRAPGGGSVNPRWGKSTGRKTVHYQLLESHVENSGRTDIRHVASRCMRGAARKGGITGASVWLQH
ncbi:hypothetical protein PCANC_14360 [Puccinia coronata f. sp. avenae]|uniref:Uncharacterized protein n=1 Tax=Puccinia coronata f. sp. avenae TaxID=200324 RepID=A0A2N5V9D5_9BASI|nr:hypothetical protein PCANC_14360 [Puccinia coronata f. sp. avenae]